VLYETQEEIRMSGTIFNIQRFCINDGPGIRTTVFFKGCPLDCIWCHNPESKEFRKEIAYYEDKCMLCGACVVACPNNCHNISNLHRDEDCALSLIHIYNRHDCTVCCKCAEVCYSEALTLIGRIITASEVLDELRKDTLFYKTSDGGITLSGGEPLAQPNFAGTILQGAKSEGFHTCVETSGFAQWETLESMIPLVDMFLYDIKETDPEKHRRFTGADNVLILDNLSRLDERDLKIVLRCPIIPGLNDTDAHFKGIGQLAESLRNVIRVDIETYHPLGIGKSKATGKPSLHEDPKIPPREATDAYISSVQRYTGKPVANA
jgi:pyruvate formate lyase activating enzyme